MRAESDRRSSLASLIDFVLASTPYMVRVMVMDSSSVSWLSSVESVVFIKSLRTWSHRECNVARPKTWDLSVLCSFGARKRMSERAKISCKSVSILNVESVGDICCWYVRKRSVTLMLWINHGEIDSLDEELLELPLSKEVVDDGGNELLNVLAALLWLLVLFLLVFYQLVSFWKVLALEVEVVAEGESLLRST